MPNDEGYGFLARAQDSSGNKPAMTGEATLNGRTVKVAGWAKVSKAGKKYLSLKFQDYEVTAEAVPEVADDDIPF